VNPIHAHQTGTKRARNFRKPTKVASWPRFWPSAAIATTKTRSKKSSSQVARRSSSSSASVRSRGGSKKREIAASAL